MLADADYRAAARFGTHLDVEANWAEAWLDYLQTYVDECGVPQDRRDEAHRHLDSEFADAALWVEPVPGSREGLRALADTGVRLGIVSNADGMMGRGSPSSSSARSVPASAWTSSASSTPATSAS